MVEGDAALGPVAAIRFLTELATLGSVAAWGYTRPVGPLLGTGAAVGLVILLVLPWSLIVAPRAPLRLGPPLRQVVELVAFGAGVVALLDLGRPLLAGVLAGAAGVAVVGTYRPDAAS